VLCVPPTQREASAQPIPTIHNVLATTDLSEVANRAVPHAYSLVRGARGVVHLCYVHSRVLPHPIYAYAADPIDDLTAEQREQIAVGLQALVPVEAERLGIGTVIHVVEGEGIAQTICRTANRLGVDAVCMGSHGRTGFRAALLGSVAEGVLRDSEKPVHVVR
jgi:nucleotide-binding universal stress UspA family protein